MYKFELESVLDYRKHIEESIKRELGEIQQSVKKETDRFINQSEEKKKVIYSAQDKMRNGALSSECIMYSMFIDIISLKLVAQKKIIQAIKQQRNQKREELIQAVKKRKILEILKEKRINEYKVMEKQRDLKSLDEFGKNQFLQRMEAN